MVCCNGYSQSLHKHTVWTTGTEKLHFGAPVLNPTVTGGKHENLTSFFSTDTPEIKLLTLNCNFSVQPPHIVYDREISHPYMCRVAILTFLVLGGTEVVLDSEIRILCMTR